MKHESWWWWNIKKYDEIEWIESNVFNGNFVYKKSIIMLLKLCFNVIPVVLTYK